jgi:hypothetical protein
MSGWDDKSDPSRRELGIEALPGKPRIGRLLLVGGVLLVVLAMMVSKSFLATWMIESDRFEGITLEKPTTSIIVVHGIGHHCIGYADRLIRSLMRDLGAPEPEAIRASYERYGRSLLAAAKKKKATQEKAGTYFVDSVDAPRDGHCGRIDDVLPKGLEVNTGDDLESAVLAQDKLCEFINAESKTPDGLRMYCHKLTVQQADIPNQKEAEYITGFIRQFEKDVAGKRLRIYEVTWSPATRWLKQSLSHVERFNSELSGHLVNKYLKNEVMNASMADAVAYLSESGILVNYDILQAFCLALANEKSSVASYDFKCDADELRKSTASFSEENDVFLISHSLGTRVVLDSIGLLSLGVKHGNDPASGEMDLVSDMGAKFRKIRADVPSKYLDRSETGFRALLNERIPEFARAIRSVYVFTNQVPLLAATASSPFSNSYQVGQGFQEFLELRREHDAGRGITKPLQIVSFHDPDDLLSYNLACWYHVAVLKNLESTKDLVETEAKRRASLKGEGGHVGDELRGLRDNLFEKSCSRGKLADKNDQALFDRLQQSDLLALRNATVRLKGLRVEALAVDPLDVHSGYFHDAQVHAWLVKGN